eukprot:g30125.t1
MSRVLWRVLLPLSLIVAIAVVHSSRALFAAPAPPSSALDALDALRARAPLAAPLVAPNAPGPPLSTERVGFYLRVGEQAGVAIQQVKEVRKVYPKARIFVLSDGGVDLSGFCKKLDSRFPRTCGKVLSFSYFFGGEVLMIVMKLKLFLLPGVDTKQSSVLPGYGHFIVLKKRRGTLGLLRIDDGG